MSIPSKLSEKGYHFSKNLGSGGQSRTSVIVKVETFYLLKQPSSIILSKEQRFRFKQEAEALKILDGVGTPKVFEYDFESSEPYILMELIVGQTLAELVAGKSLDEDFSFDILTKLVTILSRIHSLGMQHRDIKPDNIIVKNNGEVYLIDFGLCRLENNIRDYRTPASKELGNRFLRLPELGKGEKVSSSVSDITFLVGIYFYMITGHQPHLLMDEFGNPPHRRSNISEIFKNLPIMRQFFDKGFAYPIGQRFQNTDDLLTFLKEKKMKPVSNNEDDPVADFEDLINSPKLKNLNEIIEFIIKAHNIFIESARKDFTSSIDVAVFGPDTDKTGYSVFSRFFLNQKGRLHPKSYSQLLTTIDEDLSSIICNIDFKGTNEKKSYSVYEQERILQEYAALGEARGKETLRALINLIKKN